jgi:hypothetical protein
VTPEDLVRWVENHRAAARREAQEIAQNPPDVEEAIAAGLALAALYGAMHGWPPGEDPITAREDREMWERFSRLRRHYGYPP